MKANELMIGDWVCVTKDFTQKYHKIRALSNDEGAVLKGIYVNEYGVKCHSIFSPNDTEPIPLTTEILEKNGFVPKFSDGCLTEYLIYKDIVDGLHEMYIRIAYFNTKEKEHKLECFDCRTGGCQIWIKYVHQLQHALRLCGIEKTIEL